MSNFFNKIKEIADDLASLEVATLTNQKGTVGDNAPVNGATTKEIFESIRAGMANAELVAYSRFELEGDSINYINNTPEVLNLVERHDEYVLAAQTARSEFFATAIKIIRGD